MRFATTLLCVIGLMTLAGCQMAQPSAEVQPVAAPDSTSQAADATAPTGQAKTVTVRPGEGGKVIVIREGEGKESGRQEVKFFRFSGPAQAAELEGKGGYLGVAVEPVPGVLAGHLQLTDGRGLMVSQVAPDSPAAKAGLARNDVVTQVGDQIVLSDEQFRKLIVANEPGRKVTLTVIQKGETKKLTAELGKRPPMQIRVQMQAEKMGDRDGARSDDKDTRRPGAGSWPWHGRQADSRGHDTHRPTDRRRPMTGWMQRFHRPTTPGQPAGPGSPKCQNCPMGGQCPHCRMGQQGGGMNPAQPFARPPMPGAPMRGPQAGPQGPGGWMMHPGPQAAAPAPSPLPHRMMMALESMKKDIPAEPYKKLHEMLERAIAAQNAAARNPMPPQGPAPQGPRPSQPNPFGRGPGGPGR